MSEHTAEAPAAVITVPPRPPTPYYPPGLCDALKNRENPTVRCEAKPARPYPCGWRCETHKP